MSHTLPRPIHRRIVGCLAWFLLALGVMTRAQSPAEFRLRELPQDKSYVLRVLYLEDERLPTLTADQRRALYDRLERLTREGFGYDVRLIEERKNGLAAYFASQEALLRRHFINTRAMTLDPDNPVDREKLRETIAADFRRRDLSLIERYLHAGGLESKAAAVETAERHFLAQLREIQSMPVAGGVPLVGKANAGLYSYPQWAALLSELGEADLVITNAVIVGADTTMPIYVIARGGITTGVTTNNPRGPLQAASMVGLLPFLSDAPVFRREGGRIPEAERLDVIATMCLHELGHLLLRYAEYYDHPHCVHVAPPGLDYYAWHRAIRDGGPCRLPHRRLERF